MGLTHIRVRVGSLAGGGNTEEVVCLVDSGAVYSLIPGAVLMRLGISPHSEREFILANGEVISRRVATAAFEYQGRRGDSMVIAGEPGDDPLIGATTLEAFGVVLDPFRRELRPMALPLKRNCGRGRLLPPREDGRIPARPIARPPHAVLPPGRIRREVIVVHDGSDVSRRNALKRIPLEQV